MRSVCDGRVLAGCAVPGNQMQQPEKGRERREDGRLARWPSPTQFEQSSRVRRNSRRRAAPARRGHTNRHFHDDGEPESLAELLLAFLARGDDPDAPRPRIRSREDYYEALAQKERQQAALPDEVTG